MSASERARLHPLGLLVDIGDLLDVELGRERSDRVGDHWGEREIVGDAAQVFRIGDCGVALGREKEDEKLLVDHVERRLAAAYGPVDERLDVIVRVVEQELVAGAYGNRRESDERIGGLTPIVR